MKWIKKTVFLVCLLVVVSGAVHTQAAYNRYLTKALSATVNLDLNKDGKKETIKALYHGGKSEYFSLHINNKTVIKKCTDIWLLDIDTRDKYIEILTLTNNAKNQIQIYRYNGKQLVLYASARAKYDISNLKKNNWVYGTDVNAIKTAGKGTIIISSDIWLAAGDTLAGGNVLQAEFTYKVKKNSIKYDQSVICKAKGTGGDNCDFKIYKKWQGYKYPRLNSNKKVFRINKGDKVRILNFKFTSAYTYMRVTKLKSKQTGWIIFRTKDINKLLQIQ